jgi:hypothetical protein
MATLGLKDKAKAALKPHAPPVAPAEVAPVPQEVPVYDPERLAAQVSTDSGRACFVQGKSLFTMKGAYLGEAERHHWYFPSEVEEENNRRTQARKRMIGKIAAKATAPSLPQKVLDAQRENAMALAAEQSSE